MLPSIPSARLLVLAVLMLQNINVLSSKQVRVTSLNFEIISQLIDQEVVWDILYTANAVFYVQICTRGFITQQKTCNRLFQFLLVVVCGHDVY